MTGSEKPHVRATAEEGLPSPSSTNSFSQVLPSETELKGTENSLAMGQGRWEMHFLKKVPPWWWVPERSAVEGAACRELSLAWLIIFGSGT